MNCTFFNDLLMTTFVVWTESLATPSSVSLGLGSVKADEGQKVQL